MNYNDIDNESLKASSIILYSSIPIIYDTNQLKQQNQHQNININNPINRNINYFYNFDNYFHSNGNNNDSAFDENNQLSIIINSSDISLAYNNSSIDWRDNNQNDVNLDNYWALLALILVLGTAAGNILVCLAIAWEKRLQNVTNYFLMSLAITDLMVAVLVMPLGILTLFRGEYSVNSMEIIKIMKKNHLQTLKCFHSISISIKFIHNL